MQTVKITVTKRAAKGHPPTFTVTATKGEAVYPVTFQKPDTILQSEADAFTEFCTGAIAANHYSDIFTNPFNLATFKRETGSVSLKFSGTIHPEMTAAQVRGEIETRIAAVNEAFAAKYPETDETSTPEPINTAAADYYEYPVNIEVRNGRIYSVNGCRYTDSLTQHFLNALNVPDYPGRNAAAHKFLCDILEVAGGTQALYPALFSNTEPATEKYMRAVFVHVGVTFDLFKHSFEPAPVLRDGRYKMTNGEICTVEEI